MSEDGSCATQSTPTMLDVLRDAVARLRQWAREARGERLEAKSRARFWSEVRAGEREAEAGAEEPDVS